MKHRFDATLRRLQTICAKFKQSGFTRRAFNSVFIAFLLLSNFTGTAQASPGKLDEKPAEMSYDGLSNRRIAPLGFLP